MKTTWISIAFYSILLLMFTAISAGHVTTSLDQFRNSFVQTGAIFNAPDIAKEKCPMGERWDGVQCLPFVQ